MPVRPDHHRPGTLARREAILRAAADVVAERGVGGATHREIAARAGVPLSTTSYFFSSIDELVLEALRYFTAELIARIDALAAGIAEQRLSPDQAIDGALAILLAEPRDKTVAQFEGYLEVSRRPDAAGEVQAVIAAFERLAESGLRAAGAKHPRDGARAVVALLDGFALHRVAWPGRRGETAALRRALRDLFIAQTFDERERAEFEARLGAPR